MNFFSIINNLINFISIDVLLSLLIGSIITLIVSFIFYRKASNDLRFETRAGLIPYSVLHLLVAYYNWNENIQPNQYISTTAGSIHYKILLELFTKYGLGHENHYIYAIKKTQNPNIITKSNKRIKDLVLDPEAKLLAKYLIKKRKMKYEVTELWNTQKDSLILKDRIWTKDKSISFDDLRTPSQINKSTESPSQNQ